MKEIRLYDYQEEMMERIDMAFRSYQSVMVQMPTGTGKTVLLAEQVKSEERRAKEVKSEERRAKEVKSEERRVKNPCVWIVVHRRELVEQIKETLNATHNVECEMLNVNESKPLDSSFFTLHSSLNPLDSSLFTLRSSLNPRVFSIQWLSKHYHELEEKPSLIIIDEAHHAVAKTYKEVMDAYPEARKLGLTATPCRLDRRGFTDLFDVLLQSWPTKKFIADGRLSLYDYMSIKADSIDQRMVFGLTKRGADGDFSLKEMSEKLDVQPSIGRLCDTILRYAPNKKGIVYAIDIKHAEHIAEYYREHGLNAVAISSKTPAEERKRIIEIFRNTNDHELSNDLNTKDHELSTNLTTNCHELSSNCRQFKTQNSKIQNRLCRQFKTQNSKLNILITVDLFGEGFDCPDVEFIQLARPTLSLAKYLQQVGRGMRVFEGKKFCLILDNVGLYRLFGLPSDERDWQSMFEGQIAGKGNITQAEEQYGVVAYSIRDERQSITSDTQTELITVMTHEGQRMDLDAAYGYEIKEKEDGLLGIVDKNGNEVLPCVYNKVELKAYGIAKLHSRRKIDRERPWIDLWNGIRFVRRPKMERCGYLDFCTTDGIKLYPRVKTRKMSDDDFVLPDALTYGIDKGLQFRTFYIQPSEPDKLYSFKDKMDDVQLWEDEYGNWVYKKGNEALLHQISKEEWQAKKDVWTEDVERYNNNVSQNIMYFKPKINMKHTYGYTSRLLSDFEEIDMRIEQRPNGTVQVYYRENIFCTRKSAGVYAKVFPQAYDIRVVQNVDGKYLIRTKMFEPFEKPEPKYDFAELLDNVILHFIEKGKDYWVYLENNVCFMKKPELVTIGFLNFFKMDNVYVEMSPFNNQTYRRAEIRMDKDICFLGNKDVLSKPLSRCWRKHYYIYRRYTDGKRFILSESKNVEECDALYDLYYDGENPPIFKKRKKSCEL